MCTHIEGHYDLSAIDLDLSSHIEQALEEHFRGRVVVVLGEMLCKQAG